MDEDCGAEQGQKIAVEVGAGVARERLDRVLAERLPEFSRARLQALIRDGQVEIGERTIVEPRHPVNSGDMIRLRVPPPQQAAPEPQAIPLAILHEDDDIIVVDKPAGLVVHPGAGARDGTLVNALLAHCRGSLSGIGGIERPGIVHRLDKGTSGVLIAAKTDRAHRDLSAQFADHGRTGVLDRRYLALIWGVPERMSGTIDAPLGRAANRPDRMAVRRDGRPAVTHYRVLRRLVGKAGEPVACLVECRLETGRTHQIRMHMAHIGHPLLGDETYGSGFRSKRALLPEPARDAVDALGRQALHAYLLQFRHPTTGETMRFESALPDDLATLINAF